MPTWPSNLVDTCSLALNSSTTPMKRWNQIPNLLLPTRLIHLELMEVNLPPSRNTESKEKPWTDVLRSWIVRMYRPKRWLSNGKASLLTIVMLTIWILFKSFKRVHRRNLSMVFNVFISSVLWNSEGVTFSFSCGIVGNLACEVQTTSPIIKKQSPWRTVFAASWHSRVLGRL